VTDRVSTFVARCGTTGQTYQGRLSWGVFPKRERAYRPTAAEIEAALQGTVCDWCCQPDCKRTLVGHVDPVIMIPRAGPPERGDTIHYDKTCGLCGRARYIVDLEGEFRTGRWQVGCAYAMSGGLCTNYMVLTPEQEERLRAADFAWETARELLREEGK